ncbi:MAG: carboxypeptidase-like regulatory domain-containing protein, partial [Ignavibacteria bacterium]
MYRFIIIMLLTWFWGFAFSPAFAQQDTLRGIVLSSIDSARIPGATIMWKNSNIGVRADQQGQFIIIRTNPSYSELIVSSIGFAKDTVSIDQNSINNILSISLVPDARSQSVIVEESGLQAIT